ncbi:type I secretion membrane fusion protein, HlyD family [Marinovum algicola DG 898]|nr:type I secretion membrane fusion protein, HlyD family [Marinovum algicola DG 898]
MSLAATEMAGVSVRPPLLRPAMLGLLTVAVFFFGFGAWAVTAPLASAVLAQGVVILDARNKVVQHFEGGIVSEILVREGQSVQAGDLMLVLSDVQSKAANEVLNIRLRTALAERARLVAERDGSTDIAFPPELEGDDALSIDLRKSQSSIFASRLRAVESQASILDQRIAELQEQRVGLTRAIDAMERQQSLLTEELTSVEVLVARGLERRSRLLLLQRNAAEIDVSIAQSTASIASLEEQISEARLRKDDIGVQLVNEATERLRDVDETVLDTRERLAASQDVLNRTEIRAHVDGQVMELAVTTVGGVVQSSQPLLTLVPVDSAFVVEAQVMPTDIENVYPGLSAQVRLTAFSFRDTPLLEGEVTSVSADAVQDQRTGAFYYRARIKLPADYAETLGAGRQVIPGMPADVQIQTSTRTLLDYLISPILSQIERSFREE